MTSGNLTVEKILAAMKAMPPRETWVVSKFWPDGRAIRVQTQGENFTLLSPETWAAVEREATKDANFLKAPVAPAPSYMGLKPFFMDEPPRTDRGKELHALERDRILDRISTAWEKAFAGQTPGVDPAPRNAP